VETEDAVKNFSVYTTNCISSDVEHHSVGSNARWTSAQVLQIQPHRGSLKKRKEAVSDHHYLPFAFSHIVFEI